MKNALILHGKPKKERYLDSNNPKPHQANWLPWLAQELIQRGVPTEIPAFPEPHAPDYEKWQHTFEQFSVHGETGIVAHSAGAGFIIRWLSENKQAVLDTVVLVAPWHDANHKYGASFFDYEIDPTLAERTGRMVIINSLDDGKSIQDSVCRLR